MADPTAPLHDPVAFEEKTDDTYAEQFAASCALDGTDAQGPTCSRDVCPRWRGDHGVPCRRPRCSGAR